MTRAVATFMTMYAGQEATVRTRHETTDWLQIGKRVRQVCILSPCLFNEHCFKSAAHDDNKTHTEFSQFIHVFKFSTDIIYPYCLYWSRPLLVP